MKKYFLLLCIPLFLFGCKKDIETVETKEEDGTTIKFSRKKSTSAKEGAFIVTNPQGIKIEESMYSNDTLHGERKLFYETGELNIVENYTQGVFAGDYKIFFKNGNLKFEGIYANGILAGICKSYYETGEPKESVTFENNEENGPFEEFHKNGKIKAKGNYLNGDNEHGLLELFDENGELIKKMQCEHGVCRTSWTREEGEVHSKKI